MKATAITLALAIISSAAFADGSLLFTPATADASQAAQIEAIKRSERSAIAVTPIQLDANAINATVINVEVEGRAYRFVGARTEPSAALPDVTTWSGQDAEAASSLVLTTDRTTKGVAGRLSIRGRNYTIGQLRSGGWVLVEHSGSGLADYDTPTEEMLRNARLRQEQRAKEKRKP